MKKTEDREQLNYYLHVHQIESVFNEALLPHLSLYKFDEGEIICEQGDPRSHLYILVKGKIKIFTTSSEGSKLIIAFKSPLEIVGDIEFIQDIEMMNTVEAVTPVHMIGVHYNWLNKYGSDYPPLLQFLLKIITRKFRIKNDSFIFNLMYPVEVRLASYLLSISFDESNADFKGRLSINNLKDAAGLIGTSYRHLNRVINQLCEEGLIERTKEYILVKDSKRLSTLANHNIYE
ncbi:Crp/Fnr family transcriptional regulator [Psychrobacillus vulpis]|uniref:Crp/Fnr family transcriptional regulator n=1 Tax=Psychrobacillus vulpis TaxID=2325572 RepID=A0A544TML1_9BACI|nr:Crp/Fnr family transcriptional regulator [Psychrobacillus vulpis]TQR18687.1 Crp/Fnr family transcriptional regulator [Psychrobacillus vulpis]